jgi:hypothetical protein
MEVARLIKVCLKETYSKVCIGRHLSDNFPIQNGLKQGDAFVGVDVGIQGDTHVLL